MGYEVDKDQAGKWLNGLGKNYDIYGPVTVKGGGNFSDTDRIRYGRINSIEELEFDKKAEFSFKEVLTPITETLFYFTEDQVKVPDEPKKGAVIFLRSCDLHGVKRLDDIYLKNGFEDFYYKRIRERVKFILMGCSESFDNCFCVSMGTNKSEDYDAYIEKRDNTIVIDVKDRELSEHLDFSEIRERAVNPAFVTENKIKVTVPRIDPNTIIDSSVWDEYKTRCIGCGRCNFVCPTCTCYTMQDIFYSDNGKAGERRRVWASCQVDGYTDMAGGIGFRKDQGARMRFKVLHKLADHEKRFGHTMCVGCGRCDDICPEYISFSACIEKLNKEGNQNEK